MREFYQGLWIMWRKNLRWKNIWAVMTQFVIRKMPHLPSTAPWTTGRSHSERCSSNGCKKNSKKPKKSKPPKTPECDQSQFWMDNKCPAADWAQEEISLKPLFAFIRRFYKQLLIVDHPSHSKNQLVRDEHWKISLLFYFLIQKGKKSHKQSRELLPATSL